jgi:hypothetical protein
VERFPPVTKTQTVSFRYLHRTKFYRPNKEGGHFRTTLRRDKAFEEVINKALASTGFFSKIEIIQPPCDKMDLPAEGTPEDISALTMTFPVQTDLFIDLYDTEEVLGPESPYMYWGIIHFVTLGFVPIRIGNEIALHADVYSSDGTQKRNEDVKGSYALWGWTPLFFFNGFKLIRPIADAEKPVRNVAVRNLLLKLHSEGKL